jgi:5-methyltetrahydropteroyltriglutamate--homocysteine methyltransferase
MRNSKDRIEVTHVGSLPRSPELIAANKRRKDEGRRFEGFDEVISQAVVDVVQKQKDVGVTIPNDGEYGHAMSGSVDYGAWWSYSFHRLGGTELRTGGLLGVTGGSSPGTDIQLSSFADRRDWNIFKDAYMDPTAGIALGDTAGEAFPFVVGPLTYTGQEEIQADIANLKAALDATGFEDGFMTAVSPGSASRIGNEYYDNEEAFIYACADAMREEYKAIIDGGLILQIDDPSIAENFDQIVPEPAIEDYRRFTQIRVEALNYALRDLPADRIRFHLCWGSWHGPHTTDIEFKHIVDLMLSINAGAYTFEAANARHEHEWKIWEDVKLPEGKVILPGIVSHATNVVEHPELVAERIERFANLVGRENVIASTDCGLGGRIHPHIAWAKLEALAQGAALATKRLWA